MIYLYFNRQNFMIITVIIRQSQKGSDTMVNPQNKKSVLEPRYYTGENGIIPEQFRITPIATQRCSGVAKYIPRDVLAEYMQNNYNSAIADILTVT